MFGFDTKELRILRSLSTPRKIQDFIEALPINFELDGESCMSPRKVLRTGKGHCIEAAFLAAAALRLQGRKPLVLDLIATSYDMDHVITVFQQDGHWGAISKTNHSVLRYRDPVYKSVRELVMSMFHEYYDGKGRKNLRSYSQPVDLSRFDDRNWMTSEDDLWYIAEYLDSVPHTQILTRRQIATMRRADLIEIETGFNMTHWHKPPKRSREHARLNPRFDPAKRGKK